MSTFSEAVRAQELVKLEEDVRRGHALAQPDRITMALDLCGLYGPEVDEACLAREPDVDNWEAGRSAPTWEQVCALARLTDYPVTFFYKESDPSAAGFTFICGRGGCRTVEHKHVEPYSPDPATNIVPLFGQRSLF